MRVENEFSEIDESIKNIKRKQSLIEEVLRLQGISETDVALLNQYKDLIEKAKTSTLLSVCGDVHTDIGKLHVFVSRHDVKVVRSGYGK